MRDISAAELAFLFFVQESSLYVYCNNSNNNEKEVLVVHRCRQINDFWQGLLPLLQSFFSLSTLYIRRSLYNPLFSNITRDTLITKAMGKNVRAAAKS